MEMHKPVTLSTAGDFIDYGYRVALHCLDCGHSGTLDLEALAARHGRGFDLYFRPLPVRCGGCGSRNLQTTVSPPRTETGYPAQP
jgi:hypothetical protein